MGSSRRDNDVGTTAMHQNTPTDQVGDVIDIKEALQDDTGIAETTTADTKITRTPMEQMEVQDAPQQGNDDTVYPTGLNLWLAFTPLCIVSFAYGLNLAIVAAAIPSLTDYFKRIDDIGWYSSAFSLMTASFTVSFGKVYSTMSAKKVYLVSLSIFEAGALLCTFARSSSMFIFGRAIVGIGAAGVDLGSYVILAQLFPPEKRPLWITIMGSSTMIGLVSAPLLGGVLIDWLGWRGCFGINIPIGVVAIALVVFGYKETSRYSDDRLHWQTQLKRFDWLGIILMLPAITCLLMALQWSGVKYRWGDARIIVLLVLFVILIAAFGYRQHQLGEEASLPLRILKMRTVLTACWFSCCANSSLAVIEYYMSIFFQGVRGYTASQSGIRMTPLLVCITIGSVAGGLGVKWLGYYNPFMIATTILAPIASGLLTTITVDESGARVLCLLGFLGFAVGIGLQAPLMAVQTTMTKRDLPIAISCSVLASCLANSIWIITSASIFASRLKTELAIYSPSVNATQLENAGLSDIREIVGSARLRDVLLGYDEAVTQTLYLPVALTAATVLGSALIEWRSVKKKQS